MRLVRYWWAGQALAKESRRLGRPLQVADVGCERGWLKHFTPKEAVDQWIGLDWNPKPEVHKLAGYHEVYHANFDTPLPLPSSSVDAVVCLHVFEHLPRPGSTIAEISRLLKPDGIFLGGSPTMPEWIARLRENYFRKKLRKGQLAYGGHITVLSPKRWKNLAIDAGLIPEFITGSHMIRCTGSKLENHRWWLRLNQIWGGLFPSLGSEAYIQARRTSAWVSKTDKLSSKDPHWRGLWISVGLIAMAVITSAFVYAVLELTADKRTESLATWLDAHQTGADIFVVGDSTLHELALERKDTRIANNTSELVEFMHKNPGAHLLLSLRGALELLNSEESNLWKIDSRLDLDHHDYLLLRLNNGGTTLPEYLLGTASSNNSYSRFD